MERMQTNVASESAEPILAAPANPTNIIVVDSSSSSASLLSSGGSQRPQWPTIDGPLGLSEEDSIPYARRFFKFGFFLLPFLWAVNCFYFWPVLRHSPSFPRIRHCDFLDVLECFGLQFQIRFCVMTSLLGEIKRTLNLLW
ncbi:probable gamma-secretase subunit PEN-2 isoform X2 [Diospyros lotus]|uniref:probable gamma-secretase subunit PEN-2 isoform X2 n=1 Tax=Diospyros lotus TaxID=55363 RepID=UPI0022503F4C|nr:probable gamma-secretase subunit PEN-2 isoform X2 [Diospyros lotus]